MANTSVKPGKFVVPQDYHEEEIDDNAEPWLEDLEDEDVEIWIMQAPPNVDLSVIQGMQMKLSGKTRFDCTGSLGDKLETTVMPSEDSGLQCSLIAPSKEDKKFHLVKKPFAGHILMTESFEIPSCKAFEETNTDRSDYPEKLKQNQHFGSYFVPNAKPLTSPKKKRKSDKEKLRTVEKIVFSSSDDVIEEHLIPEDISMKKKKEKKRRPKEESEELNDSSSRAIENLHQTDITINDDTSGLDASTNEKEKRKKKKKKKDLSSPVIEVKQEPTELLDSSDVAIHNKSTFEESPIRKKRKKKSRHAEEFSTEAENYSSAVSAENCEKRKSKDKMPKIKQERVSPDRFTSSQDDDDGNVSSKRKKKKKKDRYAYGSDEDVSLEELERVDVSERRSNKHDFVVDISTDPEDSEGHDRTKSKKKKVKVKKEKNSPDRSLSHNGAKNNPEDEDNVSIKEEKCDPIFENSFSPASFDSSSKSKKKKSKRHSRSEISYSDMENEEIKPDIESIPIVITQGKEFKLDKNLLKAAKLKRKEKRRKSEAFD